MKRGEQSYKVIIKKVIILKIVVESCVKAFQYKVINSILYTN